MRWGMRFSRDPVELTGRVLPPEELLFNRVAVRANEQGDWTTAFRSE